MKITQQSATFCAFAIADHWNKHPRKTQQQVWAHVAKQFPDEIGNVVLLRIMKAETFEEAEDWVRFLEQHCPEAYIQFRQKEIPAIAEVLIEDALKDCQ